LKCLRPRTRSTQRAGFTLAEAAITIAIVGISLAFSVQALNGASQTAAHTQRLKIARELNMEMLGEIASGLWAEDLETLRYGTFASKERPSYSYELALGDEQLEPVRYEDETDDWRPERFDNWAFNRERELDENPDLIDEESEEPFEKVRIRVSFPPLPGLEHLDNFVEFERWFAWSQVYMTEDEDGVDDLENAALPGEDLGNGSGAGAGGGNDPSSGGRK
jgi:hypothetical protein